MPYMTDETETLLSIHDQTVKDLKEDLQETLYLLHDRMRAIDTCHARLIHTQSDIAPTTFQSVLASLKHYQSLYATHHVTIKNQLVRLIKDSEADEKEVSEIIRQSREFLRVHQQQVASLITSTDWQSPSFGHGLFSRAGRQTDTIYATINDYKRDQHWDAHTYERAFVKEYVDNLVKFPINAYATVSGMAAFATILSYLLLENKSQGGPILIGSSIYFQNKALIQNAYGGKIISIDENNTQDILNTFQREEPSVLVFDSLENSPGVAMPDFATIIPFIATHAKKETYLVIDNTCLSVFLQPLKHIFGKRSHVRLIVFESLQKYHQFGMDRVTGGILWSYGGDTIKLFDYRVNMGTNIPDASVVALPTPNRAFLAKRLVRHDRNTMLVATRLQQWIDAHPDSPFETIVYPGLPNHPSFHTVGRTLFHGSYIVLQWKQPKRSISAYKKFISLVMKTASKQKIDLVSGTSFGFDHTRVYVTALRSTTYEPFVRISVGSEHRQAIEAVMATLLTTLALYH